MNLIKKLLKEVKENSYSEKEKTLVPIKGDIVKVTKYGADEEDPQKWVWNGAKGEIVNIENNLYSVRITNLNNSNVKNSKRLQKKYKPGAKWKKTLQLKRDEFEVQRPHEYNTNV